MGRGDKRSKKGKIFKGSFGKSRPHEPKKKTVVAPSKPKTVTAPAEVAEAPKKKAAPKKKKKEEETQD